MSAALGETLATTTAPPPQSFSLSVRQLVVQGWPILVGQLAVLGFATIDTLLLSRHGVQSLAALAVAGAIYIIVFIGLMGVVMAIGPIVGRLFGARDLHGAGRQLHQAVWVALGCSVLGSGLLMWPTPFLALAQADAGMDKAVRGYLSLLALSLPASMLFAVYRGFNNAVSRPKAVMVIQLGGLALKLPLASALIFGLPGLGLPALGVLGAGLSTALCMWAQALVALAVLRRDPFYDRFAVFGRGLDRPHAPSLRAYLRLGLPMGGSIVAEVAGFTVMAFFIARLGPVALAGHQIAMNFASLIFMLPIALASAGTALVAQRIGARREVDARRLARHTLALALGLALLLGGLSSLLRGPLAALYSQDSAVVAVVLPVLALFWLFHVADALQIVSAFVLRAYHVTLSSLLIYVAALWGVGLGLGQVLAFNVGGEVPAAWQGAQGFWLAATAGVCLAAVALVGLLWRVSGQPVQAPRPAAGAAAAGA